MGFPILEVERKADPDRAWITMAVRMKLDLVGSKISLADWQAFPEAARAKLHDLPDDAVGLERFASSLSSAMREAGRGEPEALSDRKLSGADAWREPGPVPAAVAALADAKGLALDWSRADRFARFVLNHFASRDDGERFASAAAELDAIARPDGTRA